MHLLDKPRNLHKKNTFVHVQTSLPLRNANSNFTFITPAASDTARFPRTTRHTPAPFASSGVPARRSFRRFRRDRTANSQTLPSLFRAWKFSPEISSSHS